MFRLKVFISVVLLSSAVLVTALIFPDVRTLVRSALMHRAQPQIGVGNSNRLSLASNPGKIQQFDKAQVEVAYGNLPLTFEPNRGQTDPPVKFLSRARNRTLWLTKDEAVLAVNRRAQSTGRAGMLPGTIKGSSRQTNRAPSAVLRMRFVGANANPRIRGEARQPGTANYFVGRSDQWRAKIPIYSRVRYSGLYPGIDLIFYGNNHELEYDLVVSPGADPEKIKLGISGAQNLRIDEGGNLVMETPAGVVIQRKPRIYQRRGTALSALSGDYVINSNNEVGFRLGSYDRRAEVVIDPVLRYSTFLGGSGIDQGTAIAVDSSNRAVVVGFTCGSLNFPITNGPPPSDACSAFITKFDFTGSHLVFSTVLGVGAFGNGVALDSKGNVYITGTAAQIPTTSGAFQTASGGASDAFVTKLNPAGTALIYSTFLGGADGDGAAGIAVDSAGNAYVAGVTTSKNFPVTAGAFQRNCKLAFSGACLNAFITKLNASGSQVLYSTFLGGSTDSVQEAEGIAVDAEGNAFVTGETMASDFPTTAGSAQPVFGGDDDAFVSEISSSGSHLIYSTFLGGAGLESGHAIALDSFGDAFVTGITTSTNFPLKFAFQPHCAGACAFVTKLNSSGRLLYSTFLGGGGENGTGIAVTPGGQAYVTGHTSSKVFPTTQNAFQRVPGNTTFPENDFFITKFSPAGKLIYSSYFGGNGNEFSAVVALDRDTNAYLTGLADAENSGPSHTFPVTPGAFQQNAGGGGDAFVAKVVSLCALSTVNRSVTICSPSSGSTVKSPVRIIAGTTDVTPVKLTQVYLDGKKIYEARLSAINVGLPIAAGTHRLTVQALDTASVFFKKSITITVR